MTNRETLIEFNYTGTSIEFEIQYPCMYKIECWGASGGGKDRNTCGLGAYSTIVVDLKKGDVLKILVAGKGEWDGYRGGGGGGSFVELQKGVSVDVDTLLCVAGGGGGSMFGNTPNNYSHGQACMYGSNYTLNGFKKKVGYGGNAYAGGGGAGYIGNGENMTCTPSSHAFAWVYGGTSFKNGGAGGYATRSHNAGGYTVDMSSSPKGGFGGGGAGSFHRSVGWMGGVEGFYFDGAGGGGGYTGGDGTKSGYANTGGGGGSYYLCTNTKYKNECFALSGYEEMPLPDKSKAYGNFGNGFVKITIPKVAYYAILKDDKYYIPSKKFVKDEKLIPVSLDFLKNLRNKDQFVYDILSAICDTKQYIDITNSKLIKFATAYSEFEKSNKIICNPFKKNISFNYDPTKDHLLKGNISINITNDNDLDYNIIKNVGTNNIKVGISNSKYIYGKDMCEISKEEILDKGIDIEDLKNYIIPFDNYKLIMCFTDGDEKLVSIQHVGFNNYKYKTIADKNISITTDYKNIYISSNKNINKLLINKLSNDKTIYSKLEKVY